MKNMDLQNLYSLTEIDETTTWSSQDKKSLKQDTLGCVCVT